MLSRTLDFAPNHPTAPHIPPGPDPRTHLPTLFTFPALPIPSFSFQTLLCKKNRSVLCFSFPVPTRRFSGIRVRLDHWTRPLPSFYLNPAYPHVLAIPGPPSNFFISRLRLFSPPERQPAFHPSKCFSRLFEVLF